jgi:hypothetical protein
MPQIRKLLVAMLTPEEAKITVDMAKRHSSQQAAQELGEDE